jgi:hypothetical protein
LWSLVLGIRATQHLNIENNAETQSVIFVFLDIDECSLSIDNCDQNSNCTNIPGSFLCTCDDGHFWNGTVCEGKKQLKS